MSAVLMSFMYRFAFGGIDLDPCLLVRSGESGSADCVALSEQLDGFGGGA